MPAASFARAGSLSLASSLQTRPGFGSAKEEARPSLVDALGGVELAPAPASAGFFGNGLGGLNALAAAPAPPPGMAPTPVDSRSLQEKMQDAIKRQDREAIRALMASRDIGEDEAEKRRKEELERREHALREAEMQRRQQEAAELARRQAQEREAQLRAAEQAAREAALREARDEREKRRPRAWNKRRATRRRRCLWRGACSPTTRR